MDEGSIPRFSVASTQARWKNLVSAVAAVVDPTLPPPSVSVVNSEGEKEPNGTKKRIGEDDEEAVAFETKEKYESASEIVEKNENNEDVAGAVALSPEFVDGKCIENDKTATAVTNDGATITVPPNTVKISSDESLQTPAVDASIFPRLQTWRKHATVALEERTAITSRWTKSFTSSVSNNSMGTAKTEETTVKDENDSNDLAAAAEPTVEDIPSATHNTAKNKSDMDDESTTVKTTTSDAARRSWAAMVDSVAIPSQVFRGRYSVTSAATDMLPLNPTSVTVVPSLTGTVEENQATRIGKLSATAEHWKQLNASLQPFEYILLLGRGMLGVNLKQCYKLHAGVYTDYLVPNGSAERSGLVHIGDVIVAVGSTDCRKGTIATIPGLIAQSPRPVHITMATSGAHPGHHVHYIDIAVAIMHGCAKPSTATTNLLSPTQSPSLDCHTSGKRTMDVISIEERNEEAQMSLVQATSFDVVHTTPTDCHIPDVVFGNDDEEIDAFLFPSYPTPALVNAYAAHVAQRNFPMFTTDFLDAGCLTHSHLRHALRHAFVLVATDRRRLVFFQRFLQRNAADPDADKEDPPSPNWMALLMLYLELSDYVEFHGMMTVAKRHACAQAIARKYFLPTVAAPDNIFQSPKFDFHSIVADSILRRLEATLTSVQVPRTVFLDFQIAAFDALTECPFRAFFISPDCARMRAFLRNTAPFVPIPMAAVGAALKIENAREAVFANNYLLFCLMHLFCLMEPDEMGENDDVILATSASEGSGSLGLRVEHAASGLCAAVWIYRKLLPALSNRSESFLLRLEQLWEIFLAPGVGSLVEGMNQSPAVLCLQELRSAVQSVPGASNPDIRSELLSIVSTKAEALAQELLLDYAVKLHPKFRLHKFHEWLCDEIDDAGEKNGLPNLNPGSLKRLLRRTKLPVGVTPHQPAHNRVSRFDSSASGVDTGVKDHCNADCAIVFGTRFDEDVVLDSFNGRPPNVYRYTCQSVTADGSPDRYSTTVLAPEDVPASLESYAFTPPMCPKPFSSLSQEHWLSSDGWEVSLVHFILPRTDAPDSADSFIYGVSLMFHNHGNDSIALAAGDDTMNSSVQPEHSFVEDRATISREPAQTFNCSSELPKHLKELVKNNSWYNKQMHAKDLAGESKQRISIGVALVSQQNHILAMRETLSLLVQDFSCQDKRVAPLVNLLGSFADAPDKDLESNSLQLLLESYLLHASSQWLERPRGSQHDAFVQKAGHELLQCLPPIPLALMFVTALLEQKIVLTSNRRSVLVSTTIALTELLNPLHWCHLILPRVPPALAADVLQYPAPFILGLPSDDPGIVDLLRDLPGDVTLVDLDIGRVMLAPTLGHDRDFGHRARSTDTTDVARLLRSQILHLAQSLGSVMGAYLDPLTWCSDNPFLSVSKVISSGSAFDRVSKVCGDFVTELLAGTSSCCYWLEEAVSDSEKNGNPSVATVVFDEDQFFHIKQGRHRHGFRTLFGNQAPQSSLALSVNEFDLVIELLLRCQNMNAYIGTRERSAMAFSSLE